MKFWKIFGEITSKLKQADFVFNLGRLLLIYLLMFNKIYSKKFHENKGTLLRHINYA